MTSSGESIALDIVMWRWFLVKNTASTTAVEELMSRSVSLILSPMLQIVDEELIAEVDDE